MSTRQRMTWAEEARKASAHPATPDEGPASPAGDGVDPGQDDYKNGDTSSWAEDVHPGPYTNGEHPATPDEGPASPAYKAAALDRRAAQCIRIAISMLGDPEGDETKVAAVEDQAMALMDLPDASIKASLKRLGEDVEEEEMEEEESKKASLNKAATAKIASNEARIARIERILIRLAEDDEDDKDDDSEEVEEEVVEEEESSKKAFMDEEAMLEEMLMEEGMMDDEEAMLEEMLMEEGMHHEAPEEEMLAEEGMEAEEACGEEAMGDEEACGEEAMALMDLPDFDVSLDGDMDDPMGVLATELDGDEQAVLASLYGEETPAAKEAAVKLRPQPKKASVGAAKLGGPVTKEASSEVNQLEQLWESAPDVSKHF